MNSIALYLIATPIGSPDDLSPRAARLLREAKLVIGEEFRPLTTLLKSLGRERSPSNDDLMVLNEHSTDRDVLDLCERIAATIGSGGYAALISDCGTPGFCDPGAPLVAALRQRGYRVSSVPGASSLMCLLSASGVELRQFVFRGFLPAEREERERALREVAAEPRAQVLMDTPYRLMRLLDDLEQTTRDRIATLGCDLTTESETYLTAAAHALKTQVAAWPPDKRKREFIILLHACSVRGGGAAPSLREKTSEPKGQEQPARSTKFPKTPGTSYRGPKRR